MQPPPRAATAHSKGGAALASLPPRAPHCPQPPSQAPWEQGGKQLLSQALVLLMLPPRGLFFPTLVLQEPPRLPAPRTAGGALQFVATPISSSLGTGNRLLLFNLTSLGFLWGFFGKLSNTCCYSKSKNTDIYKKKLLISPLILTPKVTSSW